MKRLHRLAHVSVISVGLLAVLLGTAVEAPALQNEAGFIAMEPVAFYLH